MVLCRPLVSDAPFPGPASVRDMAQELVVTEAAIKQHLQNLYDKFDVPTEGERRLRLANEGHPARGRHPAGHAARPM